MSETSKASPVRKIVVVGRDEALWLAVSILRASFSRTGLEIVAVELPSMLRSVDVTATLRNQVAVHGRLGIQEAPLLAFTRGTYSLGQRFSNFAKTRPAFMHGFGAAGSPINRVPFHHYWLKARAAGLKVEFEDFSLNAVAARQGRFFIPDDATDKIAKCDYTYHMSAGAYCQVLKQVVLKHGILHVTAPGLDTVSRDPETGHVTAVRLANGESVAGDFFIDATGAESLLLGRALETRFESWSHWFPCDRLLTTSAPALKPLPSFSQISAFRSGWVGQYPLRDRTAIRQVYSSVEIDEQEALQSAAIVTSMRFGGETILTPYAAGRRQSAWSGNCVGIGEAAAVFDPIDNVGVQAILVGMAHLTSLIPRGREMAAESREYNLNVTSSFERIRDYQICHYKLNQRFNQPLWDHCRDMALPEALAYKLELFQARGHLMHYDDETFIDADWWSMFLGHGLMPRAWDPVADQTPDGEIMQRFQHILGSIKSQVTAMKPMEAHLKQ